MATHRLPILGPMTVPETGRFFAPVSTQLTLTGANGGDLCCVMPDPNGTGDLGIRGSFHVPQNYVGTPVLVIQGILDGAPTTTTIAFGFRQQALADNEAYDVALDAEQITSASSVSHVDEDVYDTTITLTGADYAAGRLVVFHFYIDDNVHTYTGNFLLTGLFFQYADA